MDKRERVIFHVDMDSFYASCELAKNPSLKNDPFVVGADPRNGQGRGVVLSCNYPARKFGVRSGMPISRAWKLCPKAKYVFPDFALYQEVSQRVMEILHKFTEKTEQVSIDEAYLDFTDNPLSALKGKQRSDAISLIAAEIKKQIKEKEKITCSIGVSNSKLVSKIASDINKPDGLTVVETSQVKDFLAPLEVGRIPGIGKVTQKILSDSFGIKTIADLANTPLEKLEEKFGRSALWFHRVALGEDESEVVTGYEPVSQSGETTFQEDLADYKEISRAMIDVAKDVHKRVIDDGYTFKNVGIKIRFSEFETHTRSKMLNLPSESLETVLSTSEKLLSEFSSSNRKVRLIGVRLSNLEKKDPNSQKSLMDWS
ncbi:MAG: DNA polymerase IV [Nitrososphaerales archaeon]